MKRLIHIEGERILRQIPLVKERYTLGRGAKNDIVFDTSKVSRYHAELITEDNVLYIVDKGSANKVYVNGEQVEKRALVSGDKINVSRDVTLLYLSENDAEHNFSDILNRIWDLINKQDFMRLKEVTGRILAVESLDNILNVILKEIIRLVGGERGFIALTDDKGKILPNSSVFHNLPIDSETEGKKNIFSHSIVRQAIEKRENVFIFNTDDLKDKMSNSVLELELRSIMCSPLIFADKPVGVLYVDSGHELSDFNRIDQFFFTILSDHAAIAIENAKLFDRLNHTLDQLKEEVQESEERYRQLVELSPEAILVHSRGEILFVNPAAVRLFGGKLSLDLIGKSVAELVHPDYLENAGRWLRGIMNEGERISRQKEKILRLDNIPIDVETTAAPLVYQGKPSVQVIFQDITEKLRMEEELFRARKIESIGILAGGIAHDFNNILTAILGNISLAKLSVDKNDEAFERLNDAEKASLRAKDLTQQLLTFSKGGTPIKKTSSISELIRDSSNFAIRGSSVRCEFSVSKDLPCVEIDEGQISQVIHNLVLNAVQSMPDGGIIQINADSTELTPESGLSLPRGKYVRISVRDQGIGIKKEHLSKIFDPYFTTKQKGSGLGLATAYSIVKKHEGLITVESQIGKGTTFFVYLPVSSLTPQGGKGSPDHLQRLSRGRILIMDDEAPILDVTSRMLKFLGYEVETVSDGESAIKAYILAKESAHPFKAVIMDLIIPGGMGGKEAVKKLLSLEPHAKVIVASGYSNDPILANYHEYGFCGMIGKPFKMNELNKVIAQVVNGG